jgi:hypothetical protein
MPRIVACGSRYGAYDRFRTSCESTDACLLLVDSEDLVVVASPWEHLKNRQDDGWAKPNNATDGQCHLMVVCMESWFLSDKPALIEFFGQGFAENSLPVHAKIEKIAKDLVYSGLQKASAHCKTKAPYGKGAHSFKILTVLDPAKVRDASPWANRFFETLEAVMSAR